MKALLILLLFHFALNYNAEEHESLQMSNQIMAQSQLREKINTVNEKKKTNKKNDKVRTNKQVNKRRKIKSGKNVKKGGRAKLSNKTNGKKGMRKIKKEKKMRRVLKRKQKKNNKIKQWQKNDGPHTDNNGKHVEHTFFGKKEEDDNYYQKFSCDIYGYTRAFSLALTNKANAFRIMNKPERMDIYAQADFRNALTALGEVTVEGTRCGGDPSQTRAASRTYFSLESCTRTVPSLCDRANIPGLSEKVNEVKNCKKRLADFISQYRESLFGESDSKGKNNYEDMCPNLGSNWDPNDPSKEASACSPSSKCNNDDWINEDRVGYRVKTPNTPLELFRDGCLPKTFSDLNDAVVARYDSCKDDAIGSYGQCNEVLKRSIEYTKRCQPAGESFINLSTFFIEHLETENQLANINKDLQALCDVCEDPSCNACAAVSVPTHPKDRATASSFTSIVDALKTSTEEEPKRLYRLLKNCSVSIKAICDPPKQTKIKECSQKTKQFTTKFKHTVNGTATASGQALSQEEVNANKNETNITRLMEDIDKRNNPVIFLSATSSSIYKDNTILYGPHLAIDGVSSITRRNFFHSGYEDFPWIQIQLQNITDVISVTIHNRKDGLGERFSNAEIRAGTEGISGTFPSKQLLGINTVCGTYDGPAATGDEIDIFCTKPISAQYITIQLKKKNALLEIDEFKVNSKVPSDYTHVSELMEETKESNCSTTIKSFDQTVEATLARCKDASVLGSHANCTAAKDAAIEYILASKSASASITTRATNLLKIKIKKSVHISN